MNHLVLLLCPVLHTGLMDIGVTLLCSENLGPKEVWKWEHQTLLPDL